MSEKWHSFQMLKDKHGQLQILYPIKWFFKNNEEIVTCSDEEKLREFVANKPTLNEWQKGVF